MCTLGWTISQPCTSADKYIFLCKFGDEHKSRNITYRGQFSRVVTSLSVLRLIGRLRAEEAARAVGGVCVLPRFEEHETHLSDFNDLIAARGFEEARRQFQLARMVAERAAPASLLRVRENEEAAGAHAR